MIAAIDRAIVCNTNASLLGGAKCEQAYNCGLEGATADGCWRDDILEYHPAVGSARRYIRFERLSVESTDDVFHHNQ